MEAQTSRFNRILLVVLVALYVISIGVYTYLNWSVETEHSLLFTLLNGLILSLPLVLFYGAIYVLVSVGPASKTSRD